MPTGCDLTLAERAKNAGISINNFGIDDVIEGVKSKYNSTGEILEAFVKIGCEIHSICDDKMYYITFDGPNLLKNWLEFLGY